MDDAELNQLDFSDRSPEFMAVLESAARLQQLVPDATLVGGSAAALYANHRNSYDHDHVLRDLRDTFDMVLEAVESEDGWATNRISYGKIILEQLGDIETGIRQLIRKTPLEVAEVLLPSGAKLRGANHSGNLAYQGFPCRSTKSDS